MRFAAVRLILAAILCICLTDAARAAEESIAPKTDWRVTAVDVRASTETAQLQPLTSRMSATWRFTGGEEEWMAVRLPRKTPKHLMITWQTTPRELPVAIDLYDSRTKEWTPAGEKISGRYLEKFELHDFKADWIRLRVRSEPTQPAIRISNIGLYELDPNRRDDYWLVVGASIQAQSIKQDVFYREITREFPDYDPVIFNRAVSGWTTTSLLNKIEEILAEHPEASYVCVHIGGNNVTRDRPYPGGVDLLRGELEQILQIIEKSGKIPILSRLSYRAYSRDPAVPPEENGSGPYVENVFDPLIEKYSPRFYDRANNKGLVDAYGWFKEHQDELSRDGIHVNPRGENSWNRLWATHAGGVVYRSGIND